VIMAPMFTLNVFKFAVGNPFSKAILARATKRCLKCNDRRLRLALARHAGRELELCPTCHMYSLAVGGIIDAGSYQPFNARHRL